MRRTVACVSGWGLLPVCWRYWGAARALSLRSVHPRYSRPSRPRGIQGRTPERPAWYIRAKPLGGRRGGVAPRLHELVVERDRFQGVVTGVAQELQRSLDEFTEFTVRPPSSSALPGDTERGRAKPTRPAFASAVPVASTGHCPVPVLSRSAKTSFPGRGATPLRCVALSRPKTQKN